jgi:tRNA(Leu) C34 or U34 (ribose-2'-O)-methylase TrmL
MAPQCRSLNVAATAAIALHEAARQLDAAGLGVLA